MGGVLLVLPFVILTVLVKLFLSEKLPTVSEHRLTETESGVKDAHGAVLVR
jgi:hypothetical protein